MPTRKKTKPSTAQVAALMALGVPAAQAGGLSAEEAAALEAEQAAKAKAEQEASDKAKAEAEEAEKARLAAEAEAAANAAKPNPLAAELTAALKQVATLEAQVAQANAKIAELEAAGASARNVVLNSLQRLSLAMNATLIGAEEANLNTLCQQFFKLEAEFAKKFPVGAQSRAVEKEEVSDNLVSAELGRRVKIARKTTPHKR